MPIDVTIQMNGHNSYRVTETVWDKPFGVQGMAYITHSFHAYAASALGAATRARTRFFAADGSITGTTDHSFTVSAIFTEVDITVAVPALSVLCQLCFFTSGTWWVAEPKTEEGETATPYNTNYSGQLSMLTPDGAYLGMLTTSQIVVAGTLANPTEALNTRLVTINNNAINLSVTSAAHGTRLTNIEAGVIVISGASSFASGYDPTTKETPSGAQAKVNALGATLGDLAYEDLVEAAKLGTTIISGGYIKTELLDVEHLIASTLTNVRTTPDAWATIGALSIGGDAYQGLSVFRRSISDSVPAGIILIGPAGGMHFMDKNLVQRMAILADGGFQILSATAGQVRFQLGADGSTYVFDLAGKCVFESSAGQTIIRLSGAADTAIVMTATAFQLIRNGGLIQQW